MRNTIIFAFVLFSFGCDNSLQSNKIVKEEEQSSNAPLPINDLGPSALAPKQANSERHFGSVGVFH